MNLGQSTQITAKKSKLWNSTKKEVGLSISVTSVFFFVDTGAICRC